MASWPRNASLSPPLNILLYVQTPTGAKELTVPDRFVLKPRYSKVRPSKGSATEYLGSWLDVRTGKFIMSTSFPEKTKLEALLRISSDSLEFRQKCEAALIEAYCYDQATSDDSAKTDEVKALLDRIFIKMSNDLLQGKCPFYDKADGGIRYFDRHVAFCAKDANWLPDNLLRIIMQAAATEGVELSPFGKNELLNQLTRLGLIKNKKQLAELMDANLALAKRLRLK